ncbi:hypothetical protein BDN67DRAFT_903771 [Paxillus ammoniavirescens]|nr:hypothetical protein BDN67DRAFT_903771 [Paxillus ammoniavirescens]
MGAPRAARATETTPLQRGEHWTSLAVDGAEFYDFVVNEVLVKMNLYPQAQSILVMDNCSTHKSEVLRGAVEASGKSVSTQRHVEYDMMTTSSDPCLLQPTFRRWRWRCFWESEFPMVDLVEAYVSAVTADKAKGWFKIVGICRLFRQ